MDCEGEVCAGVNVGVGFDLGLGVGFRGVGCEGLGVCGFGVAMRELLRTGGGREGAFLFSLGCLVCSGFFEDGVSAGAEAFFLFGGSARDGSESAEGVAFGVLGLDAVSGSFLFLEVAGEGLEAFLVLGAMAESTTQEQNMCTKLWSRCSKYLPQSKLLN